jgi:hypothetical protein
MENNSKADDTTKDEDKETESFFDRHPIFTLLMVFIVSGFITSVITVWAITQSVKSSILSYGNAICVGTECITIESIHKDNPECADTVSQTDETDDVVGPDFSGTDGVVPYTFIVESKDDLRSIGVGLIRTESGYTLEINTDDDRYNYNQLYEDLKTGHQYTYNVRENMNFSKGEHAIIVLE